MATFGNIEAYDANSEQWSHYIERLEYFFIANDITTNAKKKAVMLSVCGADTYKLLRSLCAPNNPSEKTYAELTVLMKQHLSPTPNIIAERFAFNSRNRNPSESVSKYVAELKRLSQDCDYGGSLNDMLRDRLVCGINDLSIQRKLLSEGSSLTFDNALKIALSMEAAAEQSTAMQNQISHERKMDGSALHKVFTSGAKQQGICFRCGGRHNPSNCPFTEKNCFFCNNKGHTVRMCRKKSRSSHKSGSHEQHQVRTDPAMQAVDDSNCPEEPAEANLGDMYTIHRCAIQREKPIFVKVDINSIPTEMEVDTGASVTVMGEAKFHEIFKDCKPKLESTNIKLRTYTGEFITAKGVSEVNVAYENQSVSLPLIVTVGGGPVLFGRNWLKKIRLNWEQLFSAMDVNKVSQNVELDKILTQFTHVFKEGIGTMANIKVHIELKDDAKPRFHKARPVPYALKGQIDTELDRLVKEGIYEPVTYSQWAAPIVPVVKEDGSVRICGDYKVTVNPAAKCDNYPVPRTEDLLATLNGGEKFTKLDLSHAYQQLLLDEQSQECLTINTHKGLYKPTRLQFGVHSAAGIFQREMEKRLSHVPFTTVRVDDILISGRNDAEHLKNLTDVFQILSANGLRLKQKKCTFMAPEVTYLGFRINKEGVSPVNEKIKPILEAPAPENVTQLKSFLGMLNYYHRHIPNMADILEPLHCLLRKNCTWNWGEQQEQAFKKAKELLTSSTLLVHYDPNKQIILSCDASPYGLGAVLAHRMSDGSERPIAYAARTLSNAERNYSQIEKEGLAIVYGVKKFHQYLYGRSFIVFSDHKPLLGLLSESSPIPSMTAARIQRWALLLSSYDYELRYQKGVANANADGMSRLPQRALETEISKVNNDVMMVNLSRAPVTSIEAKTHTRRDPVLSRVLEFVLNGWPEEFSASEEFQPYGTRSNELAVESGCLLWGSRVIIPPSLRETVLTELHQVHLGMSRMKSLARCYCWWPSMDSEIEQCVRSCKECVNSQNSPSLAPLHPWENTTKPWARLHVDYAGPFLGKMFLIVIDSFSKWIDAYPVTTASSTLTIEKLRHSFAIHGLPDILVSDNATCFTSQEFNDFMKMNGIHHVTSAPYHPSSNGAAERAVQTFKSTLKKLVKNSKDSIETQVNRFLFSYRNTPHTSTGVSPAEILLKRQPKTQLSLLKPDMVKSTLKYNEKMIADRGGSKLRDFEIGENVIARNYTGGQKWLCGVISEKTGPVSYKIKISGGVIRRHIDQIRQYKPSSVQDSTMDVTNFGSPMETLIPMHENPVIPPIQIEPGTQRPASADSHTLPPTHIEAGTPEHGSVDLDIEGSYVQMPTERRSVVSNPQTQASTSNSPTSASTASSRPVRVRTAPKYLRDYAPK